ncbi:hypothetical protein BDZ90DRAFT_229713 [Jaminaea rosea]|uniref:THO complex subunit 2 n=1 Tax=Jaminaea rosea TaxID=1569628 RepID=A0A316UZI4_9BASI|nr:hypothetical protein BDZ90DRAFT_229713 [Jaminaea rosea]PWN30709.1 hypothetical protein BDZ90DRAFT_229713 [Jaminaea rosea]
MVTTGSSIGPHDSATGAGDVVSSSLRSWDQGGREQLYAAFQSASNDSPDNAVSPVLVHLLGALLSSHVLSPQLSVQDFRSLFEAISPPRDDADKADASEVSNSPGPSRHASATPVPSAPQAPILSSYFSNSLLDVIWAVDVEIDMRRDAAGLTPSDVKGKATSPAQEAETAKTRLADLVAGLITSNHLARIAVAERLDVPLLVAIGLVSDEADFNRKGVRINTANLYKQQKFNLLREENEGYSGLMNEILGGMGPPITVLYDVSSIDEPHNWQTAPTQVVEQERPAERNRRVRAVMRNISALIGYFDLDPNRVLDIILDLFSTNVTLHWPFFLALLWASPWARGRKRAQQQQQDGADAMDVDETLEIAGIPIRIDKAWGNHTCAQLVGFKFDYYRQQDTREDVPVDLYTMSALLIQHGFVRFADLWPHLSPDEEGMKKLSTAYTTSLKDKANSARSNALTMAAPLADDEGGAAAGDATKAAAEAAAAAAAVKEPPNQVLGLLKALLATGQLDYSLFILALHPWLIGAFPEVADLLIRLVKEAIRPVYEPMSSASQVSILAEEASNAARPRYDTRNQAVLPLSPPRLYATSLAPEPPATATSRFVFAFGDCWKKQLPICTKSADLVKTLVPLLRVLGVALHRDFELFQQICRLGRVQLKAANLDEDIKGAWLEIVRFHLFPALSLTAGNSGLLNELWSLLKTLSYTERFSLYGEWKNELYRRPEVRFRQLETEKEARGILKRISKDNLKLSGRALAKASHANPLIFFTVALNQVQVYDNMIPHIAECAKYLTIFEYDVFSFNLIDALSNPEKERTKQDGQNISLWLKSLASFTGTLYRRYAMMDPVPVLQYICNQLKANNSKDLVIISELILKMSGIEPLANLADNQIAALSGGRLLRMEAMMVATAGPGTAARRDIRRTGARLMDSLRESRLAVALLILIAQQRQVCVHLVPEPEAHLRYLANLADNCQEVLFQYVEFLYSQLEPGAYADLIPSTRSLCERFSIEPAIAFHIARPRLLHSMKVADDKDAEEKLRAELMKGKARAAQAKKGSEGKEGDVKKEGDEGNSEVKKESTDGDVEMGDVAKAEESDTPEEDAKTTPAATPIPIWRKGLSEAVEAADAILSDESKRVMGKHFFATFWQLSLADIQVPSERYEQEMRTVQRLLKAADTGGERKSNAFLQHQDSLDQLRAELKARTLAHQATRRRLLQEKDHWFPHNEGTTRPLLVQQLIQHCLIPRALLSPTDAMFAAKFIRLMHLHGTRNFPTVTLYDRLFIEHVAPIIFSSTENEANSYARFLQVLLDDLAPWYKSEELYTKEVIGEKLPGFQMRWGSRQGGEEIPQDELLSHSQFRNVVRKWHDQLAKAFKLCLTSGDFMRIRNAIAVMNRLAQRFPLFDAHGRELIQVVEKLTKEETRGSLKVLGQGLLATLKKYQKEWLGKPQPKIEPKAVPKENEAEQADRKADEEKAQKGTTSAAEDGAASTAPKSEPAEASATTSASPSDPAAKATNTPGPETSDRPQRQAAVSNAASPIPTGPSNDQRKASIPSSGPPKGPSAASNSGRGYEGSPPARPGAALSRTASNGAQQSARTAPRDTSSRQGNERLPPTGPRGNPSLASSRPSDATATKDDDSLATARQAALGTMMNPPQAPASTLGAQAAREKGTPGISERERANERPSSRDERDREQRDRDRDRPRDRDRGRDSRGPSSAAPSRGNSPSATRSSSRRDATERGAATTASPRDTTPARENATAGGETRDSGWGPRRERGERDRERERDNREQRERERDRDQRDRDRDRDRDRERDDRRRGGDSRRSTSDRYGSDRGRGGADTSRDRDRERERDSRRSGAASNQTAEEEATANAYSQRSSRRGEPPHVRDRREAGDEAAHQQRSHDLPPPPQQQQQQQRTRELFGNGNGASTGQGPASSVPQRVWGEPQGATSPAPLRGEREAQGSPSDRGAPPSGPSIAGSSRRSEPGAASQSQSMYPPRRDAPAPPAPHEAGEASPSTGGGSLKRSLADRLAGGPPGDAASPGGYNTGPGGQRSRPASRGGSPASPSVHTGGAQEGGPDAKRPRMQHGNSGGRGGGGRFSNGRNSFGGGGGGDEEGAAGGGARSTTPTGPAARGSNSPATGGQGGAAGSGLLRQVSISGSAARERERERREGREGQYHAQPQGQQQDEGYPRPQGHRGGGERRGSHRRNGGRGDGDRFKDRARRRAGEE